MVLKRMVFGLTLQQLKYALEVANKGSINEAAKSLYISQPSLSNAIMDLEKEIKITIFIRTNRGVAVSNAAV
jgi:DNA-binding transcriptional LysR family regulator